MTIKIVPKNLNPCLKSFASSHKAPSVVGPQISKHELMLKSKKGKEFIYLFISFFIY
jgi:hypothetical protein